MEKTFGMIPATEFLQGGRSARVLVLGTKGESAPFWNDMKMGTGTGKTRIYWHVYPQDQIQPRRRGTLVYVLQIPTVLGPPVMRDIFDPQGLQYPANLSARLGVLLADRHEHGLLFRGVNEAAIDALIETDPPISAEDPHFFNYNWRVIRNSLDLLLLSAWNQTPAFLESFAAARNRLEPSHCRVAGS